MQLVFFVADQQNRLLFNLALSNTDFNRQDFVFQHTFKKLAEPSKLTDEERRFNSCHGELLRKPKGKRSVSKFASGDVPAVNLSELWPDSVRK